MTATCQVSDLEIIGELNRLYHQIGSNHHLETIIN